MRGTGGERNTCGCCVASRASSRQNQTTEAIQFGSFLLSRCVYLSQTLSPFPSWTSPILTTSPLCTFFLPFGPTTNLAQLSVRFTLFKIDGWTRVLPRSTCFWTGKRQTSPREVTYSQLHFKGILAWRLSKHKSHCAPSGCTTALETHGRLFCSDPEEQHPMYSGDSCSWAESEKAAGHTDQLAWGQQEGGLWGRMSVVDVTSDSQRGAGGREDLCLFHRGPGGNHNKEQHWLITNKLPPLWGTKALCMAPQPAEWQKHSWTSTFFKIVSISIPACPKEMQNFIFSQVQSFFLLSLFLYPARTKNVSTSEIL